MSSLRGAVRRFSADIHHLSPPTCPTLTFPPFLCLPSPTPSARHFLFVTVPPFDLTPLGLDGSHHDEFVSWTHIWNFRMRSMIKSYSSTFPEMEARIWDMNESLTEVSEPAPSSCRPTFPGQGKAEVVQDCKTKPRR